MGKKAKNTDLLNESQLTSFLPDKNELKMYAKYEDKTDEELDQIAENYVKLAFVLLDISKQKALEGNKKSKSGF